MISVCMATYNGERFLREQIDSILCQLNPEDELIISDDGSTDGTLEIIASYQDSRIKLLHHKKKPEYEKIKYSRNFYYATDNFENALKAAQGDYIFLADQDDVWMENKVEICLGELQTFDCVVSNYTIIDENNAIKKTQQFSNVPIHSTLLMNVLDNHFRGCCIAFRGECLKYLLPFPFGLIGHDYWIGTLVTYYGKTTYIMEPLIKSRWYLTSVSAKRRNWISRCNIFYKLSFRIKLLILIIKRIYQFQ